MVIEAHHGRPREMRVRATGRSTRNKLGLDGDFGHVFRFAFDEVDECLGGDLSHALERLTDGRQPWAIKSSSGDVVEAHHRNVFGDAQAGFAQRPNGTDRGNVVVSEQRGERLLASEELLGAGVAELRRGKGGVDLNGELRTYANTKFGSDFTHGSPANGGVGAGGMTFQEGDLFVSQFHEMGKREPRRKFVIQDNVGDTFDAAVSGDRDRGELEFFGDRSVGGNETLDATRHEHLRIGVEKLLIVPVDHGEKEEIVLSQIFFDPADDQGSVSVADFFGDDTNRVGALEAERAGEIVGTIVEVLGGLDDAFLGVLGDGASGGGVVERGRDGAGGEAEVGGNGLKGDSGFALEDRFLFGRVCHASRIPRECT